MIRNLMFVLASGLVSATASYGEVLELRGNLVSSALPQQAYSAIFTYLPEQQEAYFSYTPIFCNECPQAPDTATQPESLLFGALSTSVENAIQVPANLFFAVEQNDATALVIHYLTPASVFSPLTVQFDLTLVKLLANGNWFFNEDCLTCDLVSGTSNVEATITSFQVVPEPGSAVLVLVAGVTIVVGFRRGPLVLIQ